MISGLFLEIAVVMMTAGAFALFAAALRQPLVIAYILTGVVVGPAVLGFAQSFTVFETLSRVGIAFLLFIVGLNLNWKNLHEVGGIALASGFAQMIVTSLAGFGIATALGFSLWTSIFLGVSFAFSSTIIVVKMLTDKEDLDRLYGRIAVGALIVQDLIAMVLLLLLSAYTAGGTFASMVTLSFGKALLAVFGIALLGKYVVPRVFAFAAKQYELLFLLAIAWCFALAGILDVLGFGVELGALLAGVALAGSGFQHEIEAKVRVVRDFFLIIFFIVLGTQLQFDDAGLVLLSGFAFAAFVLIGNPLIMLFIMRVMGYHPRTGFLAGTTVAQISEFSFILLGGGIAAGLVVPSALPLATFVALVTIACSSYLITYNERIFTFLATHIAWFRGTFSEKESRNTYAPQVVLLGFDRMGKEIFPAVRALTNRFLVVDFNPVVVEALRAQDVPVLYGDAGSEDVLRTAQAFSAKMIISTIPDREVNAEILGLVQHLVHKPLVIVTVKNAEDAARCYALGAHFVIVPSILGGVHFAQLLKKAKLLKRGWEGVAKKYQES